jgi:elongation factor G
MEIHKKRNVAIVGHAHAGKTSLVESMLFCCGATSRKGDVMQGNSISDYNEDERERKISINASFLKANYKDHALQIIDTPGYSDFFGDTISALTVADAAVVVIDAVGGIEVGTEDAWQKAEENKLPRLIFINKENKEGANVDEVLSSVKTQLSQKATIIDFESSDFVEAIAESDDALLEKYLEAGELSQDEVKGALRKAVLSANFFPVFIGDALEDKGVKEMMDAIVSYCPSPVEHPGFKVKDMTSDEETTITPSEDGPFAGYVFKSIFDSHLGQLSMMRVLRGSIQANANSYNVTNASKEHIGTINFMHGKEQVPTSVASCGDIVALTKLKNTHVSDTLADEKAKILCPPIAFPHPAISASIKPKTRADEEKIATSLHRLCEEDRTFQVNRNDETKEMIISGIGDLHLKVMLERMKSRYNVEVELGTPKVSYRETITKHGRARYKHKKQSGGHGQYGDVDLEVEPLPQDSQEGEDGNLQYAFESKIFGGAIPKNYIPSVEKGAKQTIDKGVLAGFPLYNIKVTVVDGSYHDVDSSDMAFQIAGAHALKDAVMTAGPVLLEPIMEVSISVPDGFIGQISGDISSRRGRIMGTETKGKKDIITAHVPLAEMFKYATDLRSVTGGRGRYSMKLSHYENVPAKLAEQIIAKKKSEEDAS